MQIVLFLSLFGFFGLHCSPFSHFTFYFLRKWQTVGCLFERVNVAAVVSPAKKTTRRVHVEMTRWSSDTQTAKKCSWSLRPSPPAALVCI